MRPTTKTATPTHRTPARITLVPHTHWDREWYEPFEVFRSHLVDMLDEALDELDREPRLHFTLDGHVALVDDYLEARPGGEAEGRIRALVRAGRLHVGPFYTQADTLLADGESLIRNLAFGVRRAEALGGAMRLGYMPDQFGHAAQIPQILRLFGIDGAVLWRGVGPERPPGAFRWIAPDGSEVAALWLQDGYGSGRKLPSDPRGFAEAVSRAVAAAREATNEVPVLLPVGDDHVRLAAWLPEAAAALRERLPGVEVIIGGYQHHLPHVRPSALPEVRGELRSPAFAPVLAGVASARIREKQMAARASSLLLRYAEPLAAFCEVGPEDLGDRGRAVRSLLARAWRNLLLNHAHDSAAGCGVDAAHEDVKARYRWAEQLAGAARDRALARLRVAVPMDVLAAPAHAIAFHPGPAEAVLTVEAQVPRGLEGELVAIGPDGIARPVQALGASPVEDRPLFEGEFAAGDLGPYLAGLDPRTPLFGKFFTGIVASEVAPGMVRLDVGLGDEPAPPGALAGDQARVEALLQTTERFKIVIHGAGATRPVLLQAGPAEAAAFVPIAIRPGEPDPTATRAGRLDAATPTIVAGDLMAEVLPDGCVRIADASSGVAVRANDLVDEGDRGDLYHFDPAKGAPVRARLRAASVVEAGPVRARLRVEQEMDLPAALDLDRRGRSRTHVTTPIVTEVTLVAGSRRVEITTSLDNRAADHRLRALVHAPFSPARIHVEHGLAVVERPLDPGALGAGTERPAPTGQHHGFVDVGDGTRGVALLSRGLPEHEVLERDDGGATLALTLLRAVGWLSRGDLAVIDHAAGPILPTPGAQEMGPHRFEYALCLHAGDFRDADLVGEARRWEAPPIALPGRRAEATIDVPAGTALVATSPRAVSVTALVPAETHERAMIVRALNASPAAVDATLRPAFPLAAAVLVDPLEQPLSGDDGKALDLRVDGGVVRVRLRPWQIATVLLRPAGGAA